MKFPSYIVREVKKDKKKRDICIPLLLNVHKTRAKYAQGDNPSRRQRRKETLRHMTSSGITLSINSQTKRLTLLWVDLLPLLCDRIVWRGQRKKPAEATHISYLKGEENSLTASGSKRGGDRINNPFMPKCNWKYGPSHFSHKCDWPRSRCVEACRS